MEEWEDEFKELMTLLRWAQGLSGLLYLFICYIVLHDEQHIQGKTCLRHFTNEILQNDFYLIGVPHRMLRKQ